MQSIYTHGTALQIESPGELDAWRKVGWGTEIIFKKPRKGLDPRIPTAVEEQGPGSWFHLPLTSIPHPGPGTLTSSYLISVILVVETIHCRITDLHIYDGPWTLEETHFPFTVGNPP